MKRDTIAYNYLLFLIWPFMSLVIAFKKKNLGHLKNILWLFMGYFGYTFVTLEESMDSYRHRQKFLKLATEYELSFVDFSSTFFVERGEPDILMPIIRYFVSRISDSSDFYYAILGLVFGYFFSRNITFFLEKSGANLRFISILFLSVIIVLIGPWEINSFRFWTGAHALIFFMMKYIYKDDKKALIGVLFTPLMHYGLVPLVLICILFTFVKKHLKLLTILFVISLFAAEVNLDQLKRVFPSVGIAAVEGRTDTYLSERYRNLRTESAARGNWYLKLHTELMRYASNFFLLLIIFFRRKNISGKERKLLAFVLLTLAFSNLFYSVPAIGSRSIRASHIMLFFLGLQLFANGRKQAWMKAYAPIFIPIMLFFIVIRIRMAFDYIDVLALLGNPFFAVFFEVDFPLIGFIK